MSQILFGVVNGNYSDDTKWVGGVKPTAADDAQFSSLSANPTIDTTGLLARSLDFITFIGTLTFASAATVLKIGDASPGLSNIALRLVAGMTLTNGNGTVGFEFVSTSGTQQTVDYAGKSTGNTTFSGIGGNWILSSGLTLGAFSQLKHTGGTLNTNGQAITAGNVNISGASVRVLTLGASTFTLIGTNTTIWDATTVTNLTLSAASSTIIVGVANSSTRTFKGGGKTYGILTYTVAGSTGKLVLTGSNTFSQINFSDITNARTLELTAGTTQIIGSAAGLNVIGTSGKLMTIQSSTPGSPATISVPSGVVALDYVNLIDITFTGGATFYAGSHSTNGGGNSGITFSDPPVPGSSSKHIFGDEGMVS